MEMWFIRTIEFYSLKREKKMNETGKNYTEVPQAQKDKLHLSCVNTSFAL